MYRDTCTVNDCDDVVGMIAAELNIGWLQGTAEGNVHRRHRMARMLLERLKDVTPERASKGAKYLIDHWEKERMPRPREIAQAILTQGTSLTEATKAYLDWQDRGFGEEEPCPCCGRQATWAPRQMADCDPAVHYTRSVPLIGCHPWLHQAVIQAKRDKAPWPTHAEAEERHVRPQAD